ncbi:tRNA nucleotidyltransferase/poly(A) polymerase [Herbaspirillum frisingense GSF30]|uniref:Poly(A) polymerase I n=1 Tax=Herbaspirillum frisingense GSF30 TaxID=864073 RepID=A0AAI9N541_9BURK|nr:polynucleotide adenylyltransferase PcnB [Herbaspirillum frisingense]EOA06218.1 tRNA nucleotidyltransferase/poly(A) polymerase [Herbaspirillum frisingense GSF30]
MIKKLIRSILGRGKAAAAAESAEPVKKSRAKAGTAGGKIEPDVLGPKQHGIDPALVSPNAVRVTQTLQDAGYKAFIVGGAVRDLLLGIKPKDFDVATNATPEQVKQLFRRAFIIGRRFQIVHVMFGQELIEVTTFRGASAEAAPKDEHGRVLRDNTFGEQHEDATRRDFTINAMYYDPASQTVLDYHGGIADIRDKKLRIIGEPEARYREDPVRMLRVVRFAAKLKFSIDPASSAPIRVMAPLIDNVPAARVFDEMLKLLMSGHALACLQQLRKEGLHHGLLPLLDVVLEQPLGEKFVSLALANTDARVKEGKGVSPGFLFASLLWHQVLEKWRAYQAAGEYPIPALHLAADDVLDAQTEKLALQRKIASDMRDIWAMQPRFERRVGKAPYKLLEHLRLRAGFDFLLLRCQSGELDAELGEWWEAFIAGNAAEREELIARKPADTASGSAGAGPKKRKRRGGRSRSKSVGDSGGNEGGDEQQAAPAEVADAPARKPAAAPAEAVGEAGSEGGSAEAPKRRRRRSRTSTGGAGPDAAPTGDDQ